MRKTDKCSHGRINLETQGWLCSSLTSKLFSVEDMFNDFWEVRTKKEVKESVMYFWFCNLGINRFLFLSFRPLFDIALWRNAPWIFVYDAWSLRNVTICCYLGSLLLILCALRSKAVLKCLADSSSSFLYRQLKVIQKVFPALERLLSTEESFPKLQHKR